MSFHEDMFHETKRERKYYERRKQKALSLIDILQKDNEKSKEILSSIYELVNDI